MHALWMVLGAFLFSSMAVCVKFASEHFNAAELVFYRGIVGAIFLGALAWRQGVSLRTRYPGMHAWRSLIGVVSLGGWFYAIGIISLAAATTLNYMSSVWMAVFIMAGTLLHWRPSAENKTPPLHGALIVTIVMGFLGVVFMLRPSFQADQSFAATVGLLSGMFAALAYMQVVALSKMGEPEIRVVFYFAIGSMLAGALAMAFTQMHTLNHLASIWLIPIGLLAALGQLCMTRAYARAATPRNTLVVASLQYSGIVFAAIYSLVLFNDRIDVWGWLGMALIVLSGLIGTLLRARSAKPA